MVLSCFFSSTYLCELEAPAEFLLANKGTYKHAIAYWACLGALHTSFVQKAEKEVLGNSHWKIAEISVPSESRNTDSVSCCFVFFVSTFPIRTGIQKQAIIKNLQIKSDFSY